MSGASVRWLSVWGRSGVVRKTLQNRNHCSLHKVTQPPFTSVRYASRGRNISGTQATQSPSATSTTTRQRLQRLLLFGAGTGFLYVTYRAFLAPSEEVPQPAKNWQITLYRKMPLRALSRLWGRFNDLELPAPLRGPLLGLYAWAFGCDLQEAQEEDLRHYRNLGEFFRRELKPDARPVNQEHLLTSPSDGKILHFGRVERGVLEQVKGVTYSLQGFLGPLTWREDAGEEDVDLSDEDYQRRLGVRPGHALYHCIIYLAPGDYHRFHSPAQWTVTQRRHFPGELLSVNPGIARWVQGLFNLNERAVYTGQWQHGFFAMCAVGATNVGSIRIYCDEELETNVRRKHQEGTYFDKVFTAALDVPKGSMFGEFNLGSTLVLVFEAPQGFQFKIKQGQRIKCGEPIGTSGEQR
ncbi:phosphatidylserine decarboxylase proenzyme, mitochondrial-like [Babylonia areolata]|uniref:phosphatidylserine decarboxylase proenzyme, mitochondrial-like n=1 Tax=Babylonia areolata TaxID=304850 RepID=UPI003FD1492E